MTNVPRRPFGVHTIRNVYSGSVMCGLPNSRWAYLPITPYPGNRLVAAWWVLTGRAYAFIWPAPGDLEKALDVEGI